MSKDAPRPKLLDVARHAHVSPATVSRVLHNNAPVRDNVRARVLASMSALGYQTTQSSLPLFRNVVALLIPDILNPFFTEIVRGVQDEAGASGLMPILLESVEDPRRELQLLQILAGQSIGGIILCGPRLASDELIAIRNRYDLAMIVINRAIRDSKFPCLLIDWENATYRATKHLIDLNHKRIAFLSGPSKSEQSFARRRGVEKALGDAGLILRPELCPASFPNVDGGFQAMSALLALTVSERPTAVIAYNDIMAFGVLHAIRAHHLRVPEDVSVIGIDDIAMAAHANPPLTTIAQPKYRMGRLAMQMLQRMIQGQPLPGEGYTLMESPLIVRESTALAPNLNGTNGS